MVVGADRARPGREGCRRDLALVLEAASRAGEAWPRACQSAGLGNSSTPHPPPPRQAMNVLLELQLTREFKMAVQEAHPQLLLALLTQTHYILELNLPKGPQQHPEAQEVATPSPQR